MELTQYKTKFVKENLCRALGIKAINGADMKLLKQACGIADAEKFSDSLNQDQYLVFKAYLLLKRSKQKITVFKLQEKVRQIKANPTLISLSDIEFKEIPDILNFDGVVFTITCYLGYNPHIRTIRRWFAAAGLSLSVEHAYSAGELRRVLERRFQNAA